MNQGTFKKTPLTRRKIVNTYHLVTIGQQTIN
jgi:hypothetical protein